MIKIDKWHTILFTLTVLSILVSGFLAGQLNTTKLYLKETNNTYKNTLGIQIEINKRLIDSLSVANRNITNTVQGNQRNKTKGK